MFTCAGARWQGCPPPDYEQLARDVAFTPQQVLPAAGRLMCGSCAVAAGKTGPAVLVQLL